MQRTIPITYASYLTPLSPWHFGEVDAEITIETDGYTHEVMMIYVKAVCIEDGHVQSDMMMLPEAHPLWQPISDYLVTAYRDDLEDAMRDARVPDMSWADEHRLRTHEVM